MSCSAWQSDSGCRSDPLKNFQLEKRNQPSIDPNCFRSKLSFSFDRLFNTNHQFKPPASSVFLCEHKQGPRIKRIIIQRVLIHVICLLRCILTHNIPHCINIPHPASQSAFQGTHRSFVVLSPSSFVSVCSAHDWTFSHDVSPIMSTTTWKHHTWRSHQPPAISRTATCANIHFSEGFHVALKTQQTNFGQACHFQPCLYNH